MIMAPAMLFMAAPVIAIPTVACLGFLQAAMMCIRYRAYAQARIVLPLVLGGLVGVPFGVKALTTIDGPVIKAFVGLLMIVIAAAFYFDFRRPLRNPKVALPFVGVISGFLGGCTSLTGPPVILFLANQGEARDAFRASLVTYFTALGVVTLSIYAYNGLIGEQVLRWLALFAPATVIAAYLGARYADRVSEAHFRRIATVSAGIMGAVLFMENAGAIF